MSDVWPAGRAETGEVPAAAQQFWRAIEQVGSPEFDLHAAFASEAEALRLASRLPAQDLADVLHKILLAAASSDLLDVRDEQLDAYKLLMSAATDLRRFCAANTNRAA